MKSTYIDPSRNNGTQSEVPSITIDPQNIIVDGYQKFSINRTTNFIKVDNRSSKFETIKFCLKRYHDFQKCETFLDIGCSAGLTTLIAYQQGFTKGFCVDHDKEYLEIAKLIFELLDYDLLTNLKNFHFGDDLTEINCERYDFVFCGAIIHWIFNLTSDFRSFNSVFGYLNQLDFKYLLIEWISEKDSCIRSFNHISRNKKQGDEEYCTSNFEKSLLNYYSIEEKLKTGVETKTFYILTNNNQRIF